MEYSAIYHRPDSEFAYLYTETEFQIRLRTKKEDVAQVTLIYGDPYTFKREPFSIENQDKHQKNLIKICQTAQFDYWQVSIEMQKKRLMYVFDVQDAAGKHIFYGDRGFKSYTDAALQTENNYFKMPYFQEIDRVKTPDWVRETVWYQIFPERFANGNTENDPENVLPWGSKVPDRQDFFGGDLQGVLDHLDDLVELGVNGIYFCPLFEAPSNHKYDTLNYFKIDPHFGDLELFKKVVQAAHQRGMKVMLDAVFNHIGDASPQWQDVIQNGAESKYADWFHISEFPVHYTPTDDFEYSPDATYETFGFTPHMPKWNTANPEVQNYLVSIGEYWINEADIDAWRLDVANEVDHHFWRDFSHAMRQLKSDFYILGEVWHSAQSWLEGDQFDATMNYAYTETLLAGVIEKSLTPAEMVQELNAQLMLYRQQTNEVMFNMLDSHDTPRILTLCNGNKMLEQQILALLFLQGGTPCIYYGTEVGLDGGTDPSNRQCMVWDEAQQDQEMKQFMQTLVLFRKTEAALLNRGQFEWEISEKGTLLVLTRYFEGEKIVSYFNLGEHIVEIKAESSLFSRGYHNSQLAPNGFIVAK